MLTYIAATLLVASVIFFKVLTYRPDWRTISHCLLVLATVVNLLCVFVIMQAVNIVVIQLVILVIIFSFYMLGQTAGLAYSIINLLPVLIFLIIQYNEVYFISF